MKFCKLAQKWFYSTVMGLLFLTGAGVHCESFKYADHSNEACFRCHGSPTFGYISKEYGTVHSLYVNNDAFLMSNHGKLNCKDCHSDKYLEFPHKKDSSSKSLNCTNCHGQNSKWFNDPKYNEKFTKLRIEENEKEFNASVHKKWLGEKMTCFSCHNPHEFDMHSAVTHDKIKYDNNMCLNCHADVSKVFAIAGKEFKPIEEIHAWLPNPWLHWKEVRCVDCHSSYTAPNRSHLILEKEYAVRDCEKCHAANTILKAKLYKYVSREATSSKGFINAAIFNNSYIIGATRNSFLDILSIIIAGLTIGGIVLHSFLRAAATKLRSKK